MANPLRKPLIVNPPISAKTVDGECIPRNVFTASTNLLKGPFASFSKSSSLLCIPLIYPAIVSFPASPATAAVSSPIF